MSPNRPFQPKKHMTKGIDLRVRGLLHPEIHIAFCTDERTSAATHAVHSRSVTWRPAVSACRGCVVCVGMCVRVRVCVCVCVRVRVLRVCVEADRECETREGSHCYYADKPDSLTSGVLFGSRNHIFMWLLRLCSEFFLTVLRYPANCDSRRKKKLKHISYKFVDSLKMSHRTDEVFVVTLLL